MFWIASMAISFFLFIMRFNKDFSGHWNFTPSIRIYIIVGILSLVMIFVTGAMGNQLYTHLRDQSEQIRVLQTKLFFNGCMKKLVPEYIGAVSDKQERYAKKLCDVKAYRASYIAYMLSFGWSIPDKIDDLPTGYIH